LIRDVIKRKPIVAMKSFDPPRLLLVGVCVALLGVAQFVALTRAAAPSGTVTIKEDVILIHPGTKLTQDDREQLNEALSSYDKSLFKVQTYKSGKLTRTMGELSDVLIDQALVSEVAAAAAKGNSSRVLQVIAATSSQQLLAGTTSGEPPGANPSASTNPQRHPSGTATPAPSAMPSASTNPQRHPSGTATPAPSAMPSGATHPQRVTAPANDKAARELIERLKPILEKYSNSRK
jgi:hypothetical protein